MVGRGVLMGSDYDSQALCVDQVRQRLAAWRRRSRWAVWLLGGAAVVFSWARFIGTPVGVVPPSDALLLSIGLALICAFILFCRAGIRLKRFREFEQDVAAAVQVNTSAEIKQAITGFEQRAERSTEMRSILDGSMPRLTRRLTALLDTEVKREREKRIAQLCQDADRMVKAAIKRRHEAQPEIQARMRLEEAIPHLRHLVAEADRQFDEAMSKKTLTWWRRWTRDRGPILEIENQIGALELALQRLKASPCLIASETEYRDLNRIVDRRLEEARKAASTAIPASHQHTYDPDHALSLGLMAGAVSVPLSIAADLNQAGSVYDALREVNGNFVHMSDFDIWLETLSMPAESLVGLASLTKGSYFEKLVEEGSNGERFANFNHPDTDIVIDGVAYQIKATDSVAYVQSVADHIPVIATSEVAEKTGVIDGGFSDVQLSEAIDGALGGEVIDFGDTILDGLSTGLGGVGIVAILRGSHSAWTEYRNTGNAADALGVGIKTTIAGVARSAVNLVELAYRGTHAVIASAPARYLTQRISQSADGVRKGGSEELTRRPPTASPSSYQTPIDFPSDKTLNISTKT